MISFVFFISKHIIDLGSSDNTKKKNQELGDFIVITTLKLQSYAISNLVILSFVLNALADVSQMCLLTEDLLALSHKCYSTCIFKNAKA